MGPRKQVTDNHNRCEDAHVCLAAQTLSLESSMCHVPRIPQSSIKHHQPTAFIHHQPIINPSSTHHQPIINQPGWWLGHPSEKYEFVNWDDDSNPILMGKCQFDGNQTTNQQQFSGISHQFQSLHDPIASAEERLKAPSPSASLVQSCWSMLFFKPLRIDQNMATNWG